MFLVKSECFICAPRKVSQKLHLLLTQLLIKTAQDEEIIILCPRDLQSSSKTTTFACFFSGNLLCGQRHGILGQSDKSTTFFGGKTFKVVKFDLTQHWG